MLYQKKVDEKKYVKFEECIFGNVLWNFVEKTFVFTFKKNAKQNLFEKENCFIEIFIDDFLKRHQTDLLGSLKNWIEN